VPINQDLRDKLEPKNLADLQEEMQRLDKNFFDQLNNSERNNSRRLIRKIEILTYLQDNPGLQKKTGLLTKYNVLKIGLTAEKNVLNKRIEQRVKKRVEQGMLEEGIRLYQNGLSYKRMRDLGLEYGVMADFFEGVIKSEAEFIAILQQEIKQYAKRQLTWFKRDKEIVWFDITKKDFSKKVEERVSSWYNS
jgi:tRNA dimethylallyltransferase